MHQEPGEESSVPKRDLPVSAQESLAEAWVDNEYKHVGINPFEGSWHYCHYPYHSLASMSSSNCCYLTCREVSQEVDKILGYSLLFL